MQNIEKDMRPGGREKWPIKIIETSGKIQESVLARADPFQGDSLQDMPCMCPHMCKIPFIQIQLKKRFKKALHLLNTLTTQMGEGNQVTNFKTILIY